MSLPKMTKDLNYVSSLANQPTETAEELKKTFDMAGNVLKDYINDDLLPAIDEDFLKITGGILKGNLQTMGLYPKTNDTYDLGTSVRTYKQGYINTLVQKVPLKSGSKDYSNHAFAFAWGGTNVADHAALRVAVDRDLENFYIPLSKDHILEFRWTDTALACFVDGTFVGNVTLKK